VHNILSKVVWFKTKLFQAPRKPEAPLVSKRGGRVIHISFDGRRQIES
jgi:hypothetical protein